MPVNLKTVAIRKTAANISRASRMAIVCHAGTGAVACIGMLLSAEFTEYATRRAWFKGIQYASIAAITGNRNAAGSCSMQAWCGQATRGEIGRDGSLIPDVADEAGHGKSLFEKPGQAC